MPDAAPIYDVGTDHQIVAFGANRMILFDSDSGDVIASAERPTAECEWAVRVEVDGSKVEPVAAADRGQAITALTEQALKALPGTGYSTRVPRGLMEAP